MESDPAEITQLLQHWSGGDAQALDRMMPLVYRQLRALAQNQMRRERGGHTLQATALVNELYLRLAKQYGGQRNSRGHFFAFAAMLMRRILTDHAKQVHREKRGGSHERVALSENVPSYSPIIRSRLSRRFLRTWRMPPPWGSLSP
jgi:RNA polymerase sigma-70 factor (ECF subfamily)